MGKNIPFYRTQSGGRLYPNKESRATSDLEPQLLHQVHKVDDLCGKFEALQRAAQNSDERHALLHQGIQQALADQGQLLASQKEALQQVLAQLVQGAAVPQPLHQSVGELAIRQEALQQGLQAQGEAVKRMEHKIGTFESQVVVKSELPQHLESTFQQLEQRSQQRVEQLGEQVEQRLSALLL